MSQRRQKPRRISGRAVILWLSLFTLFALMTHSVGFIFAMALIDVCALMGWYA